MMGSILLAAAVKNWALGLFLFCLGLSGLFLLVRSGWDKEKNQESWKYELAEGGFVICGLLTLMPILMLVPEETRNAVFADDTTYVAPYKGALALLAVVVGGGIWIFMRLGLPHLRRFLQERPRRQRQGRPSPPGQGRRSKKRRR